MGGCCGGGGWAGGAQTWLPGNEGQLFAWEVTLPGGGEPIIYDTDSQAYAAVARTGGGVRRIKKPGT
jgi:hypothetical protein